MNYFVWNPWLPKSVSDGWDKNSKAIKTQVGWGQTKTQLSVSKLLDLGTENRVPEWPWLWNID